MALGFDAAPDLVFMNRSFYEVRGIGYDHDYLQNKFEICRADSAACAEIFLRSRVKELFHKKVQKMR